MAKKILNEVEAGNATAATFLESEDEVVTLMSRDKLGSFKQSKEFKELMAKVGGYILHDEIKAKGGKKRGGSMINISLDGGLVGTQESPPSSKTTSDESKGAAFRAARAVFEAMGKEAGIA
uniref:Uncharacterized protein n=1 Tax=Lotharella oceanica TaxID=641309 RepID=A0A7S2XHL9_9EUKA